MRNLFQKLFRYKITSIYFIAGQIVLYITLFIGVRTLNMAYDKLDDAKEGQYAHVIKAEVTASDTLDRDFYLESMKENTSGNCIISEKVSFPVLGMERKSLVEVILSSNEELKYQIRSGRIPGSSQEDAGKKLVAVGKDRLNYTYMKDGIRYIDVCGESYEVVGELGSEQSDYYDYKMVFHIQCMGEKAMEQLCSMQTCVIDIVSEQDIVQSVYDEFYKNAVGKNNGLMISAYKSQKNVDDVAEKVMERQNIRLNVIIYIFCIVNCVIISEYWIMQRRQEIAVRKVCGATNMNICMLLIKDVFYMSLAALVVFLALYIPYDIFANSMMNVRYVINIRSVLIVAGSIFIVSLVTICIPMKKVMKMKAAEGVLL